MKRSIRRTLSSRLVRILAVGSLGLMSCGSPEAEETQTAATASYTLSDFERLRWIEGRWRGAGPSEHHFYEQYRFVGDTLIVIKSSSDSTFSDSTGGGTVAFNEGSIVHQNDGVVWEVARLDSVSLSFQPVSRAAGSFRWSYESDTSWVAQIEAPGGEQTYTMVRVGD